MSLSKIVNVQFGKYNPSKSHLNIDRVGRIVIQLGIPANGIKKESFDPSKYELVSFDFNGSIAQKISFAAMIDYGKSDSITQKLVMNIIIGVILGSLGLAGLMSLIYVWSMKAKKSMLKKEDRKRLEMGLLKKNKGRL